MCIHSDFLRVPMRPEKKKSIYKLVFQYQIVLEKDHEHPDIM